MYLSEFIGLVEDVFPEVVELKIDIRTGKLVASGTPSKHTIYPMTKRQMAGELYKFAEAIPVGDMQHITLGGLKRTSYWNVFLLAYQRVVRGAEKLLRLGYLRQETVDMLLKYYDMLTNV